MIKHLFTLGGLLILLPHASLPAELTDKDLEGVTIETQLPLSLRIWTHVAVQDEAVATIRCLLERRQPEPEFVMIVTENVRTELDAITLEPAELIIDDHWGSRGIYPASFVFRYFGRLSIGSGEPFPVDVHCLLQPDTEAVNDLSKWRLESVSIERREPPPGEDEPPLPANTAAAGR